MPFLSTRISHFHYNSTVCCFPAQQSLCLEFSQCEGDRWCVTGVAKNYLLSMAGKSLCEVNRRRMEISTVPSRYLNKAGEELLNRRQ